MINFHFAYHLVLKEWTSPQKHLRLSEFSTRVSMVSREQHDKCLQHNDMCSQIDDVLFFVSEFRNLVTCAERLSHVQNKNTWDFIYHFPVQWSQWLFCSAGMDNIYIIQGSHYQVTWPSLGKVVTLTGVTSPGYLIKATNSNKSPACVFVSYY